MSSSPFLDALRAAQPSTQDGRRWLYIPYDQLSDSVGPLAQEEPTSLGLVLVESTAKASRRPYHKQKLALILANQRHFAVEQAARGVAIDYITSDEDYDTPLREAAKRHGPLEVMRPAEYELRETLAPLLGDGSLIEIAHEGWLTRTSDFEALGEAPWRMDVFYRRVRTTYDVLMENGKPLGGRYSFDGENRKPWRGDPEPPVPPTFTPDAITREVCALVAKRFADHPGRLDPDHLPATLEDAETLWAWALGACLPTFGPFEDAMVREHRGLFHTRISPLMNLHRLLPRRILEDVLEADLPLNSKEGFVRQVLGWREFVRHVHEATDGFRALDRLDVPLENGLAAPSFLDAHTPLPPAYWGEPSGLACLDQVVEDVWDEAWSHHITRLMVLSNIATLLDVSPRELTDWFWVAYQDAFDWVVEPNVLAMGTFGTGDVMTTKPYISGAAYLHRMSNYCDGCAFHPKKNCPITPMYWAFLARHEARLADNSRLRMPLASLRKRSVAKRAHDAEVFDYVRSALGESVRVSPDDLPSAFD